MDKKILNSPLWGRLSVGLKLATFPTLAILVVAGLLMYTMANLRYSKSDALVIDMAGRQRMLNQRHLKEIILSSQGFETDYYFTRKVFNETLQALTIGGPVIMNLETGEKAQLPPAKGDAVLNKLADNERLVTEFTEKSDEFVKLSPKDPEYESKLSELYALNDKLHTAANEVVKLISEQAESRIATMIRWEIAIAFLVAILGILYWRISTQSVLKPLNNIVDMSKNISVSIAEGIVTEERVDINSTDEIGQMGIFFNKMVDSVEHYISERKETEEALRESEKKHRMVMDNVNDVVYQVSIDDNAFSATVTFINNQVINTVGYKSEEFLEDSELWFRIVHPEDLSALRKSTEKIIKSGKAGIREYRIKKKTGEYVWIEDKVVPQTDETGKVVGMFGVARDVTERKRAEEELRGSEEKYRTIVESSHELIWTTNREGFLTFINENGSKALGYKIDQLLGNNTSDFIHPDDLPIAREYFLKVIHEGQLQSYVLRIVNREGEYMHIQMNEIPILDKDKVVGVMAFGLDITEQKRVEEALRESEEKFRGVIEQSNDGIYVLQGNRFVFINPRFTEITGFGLEEISAEDFNFKELVAEEGLKILDEREAMRKRGEEPPGRYIFKGLRKDGQKRDLEVSVTVVEWQGDSATLGVLHDVTDRIQTRMELEHSLEKAQEGERVKSLFMANMSHEIRTPLNAILGFTDLLETITSHLVGEEEQGFFATIRDSGNRLMDTVHEILDISQIEAGTYVLKMEQIDLLTLVKDLVNGIQPTADKRGLKVDYTSEIDSAFIKADLNGVSQAISNIIDNAIKYTKQGKITVSIEQKSKRYILSIQDTGIGISEEYLDNMFEAFSQESEGYTKKYQGIGLGMAIAKRHLDMNQVGIDVESTKDVGTTFTLTFKPVKKRIPKKKVEKEEPKVKPIAEAVDKPLVLLVEDDTSSQQLTEFFLKGIYDIYFAVSVNEAKQQLKKYPVDLVLLDLSLVGNEDGLDLVRWMRKTKTWQKTPVIATTAHAFTKDRDNCIAAGCDDYVSKPIKREKLLEKISEFV